MPLARPAHSSFPTALGRRLLPRINGWLPDADNEGLGTLESDGTTLVTSEATDTVSGAAVGAPGTATQQHVAG